MKKLIKKLKGFTLIELLAVIVILAIIALIAVPLILNMIEESRIKSAVISGRNYVKAVNYKIAQEELKGNPIVLDDEDNTYVIGENELEIDAENIENITGEYILDTVGVTWAGLCVNKYPVVYYNGKASYDKGADYCGGESSHFVEPNGELVSAICESADGASIYTNNTEFKIKTLEDLTCLSNSVNEGKDFNGKTIHLVSDIDFAVSSSYKNFNTQKYGDMNGDGTIEGLSTELTTGKGFKPIGNSNKPFKGTFNGYAFTISNLLINRPSESYVGLIGNNDGTVSGITMRNANVIGQSNVGALIGYSSKPVKNVDIKGTVKGSSDVGGVIGYVASASLKDFVFSGSVEGVSNVAGATGNGNSYSVKGVVYDTTVKATGNNNVAKAGWGNTVQSDVMVSSTTTKSPVNNNGFNGTIYTNNDMVVFDRVLDTYVGGDNDSDGYYFDYDTEGNITLYSSERKSINNKLKGTGTEESPYIIRNANDWKKASTTVTQGKYYSVISDIDFTGKVYYPLGTANNKFSGSIYGNDHTISNVTVNGYDNVGLFGYNIGTITGLKFNNITIKGTGNNVGLIGNNDGTVSGITMRNANVIGQSNVGALIGYSYKPVKNVDIKGTVNGYDNVGGVIGYVAAATLKDFVFSGSVEGVSNVAGATGNGNSYSIKGVVYDTTVKATGNNNVAKAGWGNTVQSDVMVSSTTTKSPVNNNGFNGTIYTNNDMVAFDRVLDTIIGGDNDSDGYYFDYDTEGNIALQSIAENPIGNTLRGSGTMANPYIISNTNDWNMIVATINSTPKYYSVTADLDFTGKVYYPIGTTNNKFNGIIYGNDHTISNVTVNGYDNVGLFGYNIGIISGLRFNNITVKGTGNNVGIIGNNDGTVNGIVVRNANVTGNNNTGILIGNSNKSVKNVDIKGTVKGNENVGGVIGSLYSSTLSDFVFNGSVEGVSNVGGAVGNGSSYRTYGVIYDSTVKATGNNNVAKVGFGNLYQYDVMVSSTTTKSPVNNNGVNGTIYTVNDMVIFDRVLDTYIGGDNDSDGYYFDYDNSGKVTLYSTTERPIVNTLEGNGTEANPYIIKNANDWKMASATVTQEKYYSVTNDIDFTGSTYYQLGTNANKFNGVIKGNDHTISNVTVNGYDNAGLFGYNAGTITGFKFNNITISATGNNVGIIGNNDGTVNGIVVRSANVTGNNNTGILIGNSNKSVKNVDIKGTVKGNENVGGVIGSLYSSTLSDFVFSGSVEGVSNVAGATGNGSSYRAYGVIYDSTVKATGNNNVAKVGWGNLYQYNVLVRNVTKIPDNNNGINGTPFTDMMLDAVNNAIDTTIGGDNDSDGYYFTMVGNNFELVKAN